ncbi:MAG TPA: DUF2277 family protein [Mycobacteriales bacterium]
MCRSIKTLRPPFVAEPGEDDIRAAALQYVRKISGFRAPSRANAEAFDRAVEAVAAATADLLATLQVRPAPANHQTDHQTDRRSDHDGDAAEAR